MEWWTETNRGLDWLGKAALLSTSLSVPGFVRYLADKTEAVPIITAVTTTLPPTAAAAIIAYRAYRKLSLSLWFIVGTIIGTAAATAALGIAGGGGVREAFVKIRTAPADCYDIGGFSACLPDGATTYDTPTSLPDLLFRLAAVYWHLWGFWGIFMAVAVGWFLGWFLARRVVAVIARRREQPATETESSRLKPTGAAAESRCLRCRGSLAEGARYCSACGQATPTA